MLLKSIVSQNFQVAFNFFFISCLCNKTLNQHLWKVQSFYIFISLILKISLGGCRQGIIKPILQTGQLRSRLLASPSKLVGWSLLLYTCSSISTSYLHFKATCYIVLKWKLFKKIFFNNFKFTFYSLLIN